jgi:hypothetical protein
MIITILIYIGILLGALVTLFAKQIGTKAHKSPLYNKNWTLKYTIFKFRLSGFVLLLLCIFMVTRL